MDRTFMLYLFRKKPSNGAMKARRTRIDLQVGQGFSCQFEQRPIKFWQQWSLQKNSLREKEALRGQGQSLSRVTAVISGETYENLLEVLSVTYIHLAIGETGLCHKTKLLECIRVCACARIAGESPIGTRTWFSITSLDTRGNEPTLPYFATGELSKL